jgi:predicted N-acetyltransferase YhbS
MPDLLVHLSKLPPLTPLLAELKNHGIRIRRAQPFEISALRTFIEQEFSRSWADEVSVGFANKPVSVFIATIDGKIVGFAAYECTRRSFFGPTGVSKTQQGRGVGTALLIASLQGLSEMGYAYGIIGGAGPVEFYQKTVGAIVIADSTPGIYTDLLH